MARSKGLGQTTPFHRRPHAELQHCPGRALNQVDYFEQHAT